MSSDALVVDASGLILGRMASVVARKLLLGENVRIVNAEKAVVSGRRGFILNSRKRFLQVGSFRKGPYHPRRPDTIVRRTVRGMLPSRDPRGREAYRRLEVYIGVPDELRGVSVHAIQEADASLLRCRSMTVGQIAQEIGWKRGGE